MQPTFNRELSAGWFRDRVLLNRTGCGRATRGEVVILRSPEDDEELLIKRIVGTEGDTVQMAGRPYVVPVGQLWVEGDNSATSRDSRRFGPVDRSLVEARVAAKVWPLQDACFVSRTPLPPHVECASKHKQRAALVRSLTQPASLPYT